MKQSSLKSSARRPDALQLYNSTLRAKHAKFSHSWTTLIMISCQSLLQNYSGHTTLQSLMPWKIHRRWRWLLKNSDKCLYQQTLVKCVVFISWRTLSAFQALKKIRMKFSACELHLYAGYRGKKKVFITAKLLGWNFTYIWYRFYLLSLWAIGEKKCKIIWIKLHI